MRALLYKEYRQYHLLPWGGLLISVALIVLSALWIYGYARTQQDRSDLESFCAILVVVGSGVLLMTVAAGLISSETGRGTVSYLLGLPVSRSRVWLAKAVAGLTLAAVAALLLAAPISLVMPGVPREGHFLLYLPDAAAWGLGVFAVTLFHSTLLARTLTVLIVAPVTMIALLALVALACTQDVTPLQYDTGVSDISLWSLVLSLPFLVASWVTFGRGELLDSGRKWRLALPALLGGLVVVFLLMLGATRWEQRYLRSDVQEIGAVSLASAGDLAAVTVFGARAPLWRDDTSGWSTTKGRLRSHNTVLVNLGTGRDVASWPGLRDALISPDGRYAVLTRPLERESYGPLRWEIYDVARGRMSYRGRTPIDPIRRDYPGMGRGLAAWSPSSDWVALPWSYEMTRPAPEEGTEWRGSRSVLILVRPDGSKRCELRLSEMRPGKRANERPVLVGETIAAWGWISAGDSLLLLNQNGEVSRYSPADGSRRALWRRPGGAPAEGWMAMQQQMAMSPDGRYLAVYAPERAPNEQHAGRSHTWICRTGGDRLTPVADFASGSFVHTPIFWSLDSHTLFLGVVLQWHDDGRPLTETKLPPAKVGSARAWQAQPVRGGLLTSEGPAQYLVNPQGTVRPLSAVWRGLSPGDRIEGTDGAGRLVVLRQSPLALDLVDPATGAAKKVYP